MTSTEEHPVTTPHLPIRIVVFGDVFDDIIASPASPIRSDTDTLARIERRPGGSAANTAAWLGSLGTQVDFVGRTNIVDTVRHETALRNSGVTAHLLGESILPTGTIVVIVETTTDPVSGRTIDTRTMLTERGANALTAPDDVSDALLRVASHLHFTGYTIFSGQPVDGFGRLIERARMHGITVSIDPASSGFITDHGADAFLEAVRGADVLFPNLDEARALTGLGHAARPAELVDALAEHFAVVALTLGRTGAFIGAGPRGSDAAVRFTVDCVPVEPVDTTGAGDAFNAGFLSGYFDTQAGEALPAAAAPIAVPPAAARPAAVALEARLRRAAERGVATASRAIESVGARPVGVVTHHHGVNVND
ncbi:carbohydrate kinase family protein [Subtercola sp. YIM 133946]|uniref:carbohydrate kinase family protein n=1 Tax=Subtercola sp. YIM 133946 TaxID=3118909 RepID=UPI002F927812